ncbi:MAG: hypothetical protein ACI8WT_001200 [Clostridium sp.]|jgi:hypothetical protein
MFPTPIFSKLFAIFSEKVFISWQPDNFSPFTFIFVYGMLVLLMLDVSCLFILGLNFNKEVFNAFSIIFYQYLEYIVSLSNRNNLPYQLITLYHLLIFFLPFEIHCKCYPSPYAYSIKLGFLFSIALLL